MNSLIKITSLNGRVIGPELAKTLIPAFLNAEYQGRQAAMAQRVAKIHKLEDEHER